MMADEAARRRELRRRRILENAEERKKKIFGSTDTPTSDNSSKETTRPPAPVLEDGAPPSMYSATLNNGGSVNSIPITQENCASTTVSNNKPQNNVGSGNHDDHVSDYRPLPDFRAENGIESVPEIAEQLRNLNTLLSSGGGVGSDSSNFGTASAQPRKLSPDIQPVATGSLSTPIVPVLLALFVCVVLSVKLDYVVSNSIALPFLLWEAHHLWCKRHIIEATSRGVGGLLGLAFVLCGVQQSAIAKLTQVMTVFKCIFEDFAFYILTVVIWFLVMGLPGAVPSASDLVEPETIRMMAADEEDAFDTMEEF